MAINVATDFETIRQLQDKKITMLKCVIRKGYIKKKNIYKTVMKMVTKI